jgi:hypothetical protein
VAHVATRELCYRSYGSVTVALPAAERRRLALESEAGAPHLVAGN